MLNYGFVPFGSPESCGGPGTVEPPGGGCGANGGGGDKGDNVCQPSSVGTLPQPGPCVGIPGSGSAPGTLYPCITPPPPIG